MEKSDNNPMDAKDIEIDILKRRIHRLTVDSVTDLLKKEGFNDRIREKDKDLLDLLEKPFAAVIIDFDKFKDVNTNYGHNKGDIYLNKISNEIERIIWDLGGQIFRWKEGDELAALIPIKGEKEQLLQEYRQEIEGVSFEMNNSLKIIGRDLIKEGMPKAGNPRLSLGAILCVEGLDKTKDSSEILNIVYNNMDKADESMMQIKKLEKSEGENIKYQLYEDIIINNEQK